MKDTLTGLDCYDDFLVQLQKELDQIGDDNLVVIYTDIKHFKYINDTYGYQVGDALLKEFAYQYTYKNERLIGAARVYSDNFIALDRIPKDAYSNEEFRKMIRGRNQEWEIKFREKYLSSRLQFCTGINIVNKNTPCLDAENVVSNANLARKVAKEMENDCCVLFDQSMIEGIRRKVEITSNIPRALENREFKVYFQPKIESDTQRMIGAEALVRWQKPDGSFIYPDEFISQIERSGQIIDVDYYVYREVFRFIADRISEGKKVVPISLNVSRVHLDEMRILEYVKDLFEEFQVPYSMVEFELTESIYLENTEQALKLIRSLHNMGIRVSMDDFGSGYSSLNLLSKLPIDIIKLDKVFLKENNLQENDKIIISCIVDMARKLQITSLCEGVETIEQSRYLKEVGCQIQQGYYFSKPVPQEVFEKLIDENENLQLKVL